MERRTLKLALFKTALQHPGSKVPVDASFCMQQLQRNSRKFLRLTAAKFDYSEAFKYTKDDLLIAIPGQTERLSLVEASRPWRRGVNTFVALEKPLTEDSAPQDFLVKHLSSTSTCSTACCSSWDATALQFAMDGKAVASHV